jgi:hypothetical protein
MQRPHTAHLRPSVGFRVHIEATALRETLRTLRSELSGVRRAAEAVRVYAQTLTEQDHVHKEVGTSSRIVTAQSCDRVLRGFSFFHSLT